MKKATCEAGSVRAPGTKRAVPELCAFWGLHGSEPFPMGFASLTRDEARWWRESGAVAVARGGELIDVRPGVAPSVRGRLEEAVREAWDKAVRSDAHTTQRALGATCLARGVQPRAAGAPPPRPAAVFFPFLARARARGRATGRRR